MCRAMKDSGVEWIREIPSEKFIINLKYVLSYVKGKNPNEINDIGKGKPYIGASDLDKNRNYLEYKNYCDEDLPYAEKEDVLVLWDGARAGLIGTNHEGYISSTIVKIIPDIKYIKKRFFYWYMRGAEKYLFEQVRGTTIPHMSREFIDNMGMIDFSLNEQEQIVSYLDKKVSQIDDIILKQKSLIEKYKAYKQSLITETVTKGLNKNVAMKDSGIEWIGDIPSNWSIYKMKDIGDVIIGLTYSPDEISDSGTLVLRSSNVQNGEIVYGDNVFVNKNITEKLITQVGDILICSRNGSRALIGKCAYIDELAAGNSFGAFMTIFRSEHNRFIFYILNSAIFKFHIGTFLTSTINQLTTRNLSGIKITLPPKDEQNDIVDFLDNKCKAIDSAIAKKEQLIEKLESYKKSLIYECVTGKREVN